MMEVKCEYNYFNEDGTQGIDIPYGDKKFRMTIILPKWDEDINAFIAQIDTIKWNSWMQSFKKDSVSLYLPRFKIEYDAELKDALIALGMGEAFSQEADFSKLGPPPLWISQVKHGAFVEVDEEGTEAAAATAVIMVDSAAWEPPRFIVDRSFFFAIQDDVTSEILFVGVVVEPE